MLHPLLSQSPMTLLKQVARFTERRQEVLAGNIANIDTPGYRLRDLPTESFQAALREALRPRQGAGLVQPTPGVSWSLDQPQSPGNYEKTPEEIFSESLFRAYEMENQPGITFQDANNRSIEHQFLEMTKNSLLQNFALQIMSSQYGQLQAAISGQA